MNEFQVCATFGWTINFSCGCILSILSAFADHDDDDNVTRLKKSTQVDYDNDDDGQREDKWEGKSRKLKLAFV